jgi:ribose transport system substrate-binding protein
MTEQPPVREPFLAELTRRQAITRGIAGGGALMSMSALLAACGSSSSSTGGGGSGEGLNVAKASELKPFVFSDATGEKPSLPSRLSFTQTDTAEGHLDLANGYRMGCEDRGLDYVEANCENNVAKQVEQAQTFLQRGTGILALLTQAPETLTAVAEQALKSGVAVFNGNEGVTTLQQIANQYTIGKVQAEMAIAWINENLGGKATVAYLNPSALAPALVARTEGAIQTFESAPGIKVINIGLTAKDWNPQGGFTQTSSLLQAHPEVEALVSGDTVIQGAVKAISAAGNKSVKYVGGTDGELPVLELVKAGNTIVKTTIAYGIGVFGYASGQFAADWMEGKSIPQVMEILPTKIDSAAAATEFETFQKEPAEHWKEPGLLAYRGSISYETRDEWIRNVVVP